MRFNGANRQSSPSCDIPNIVIDNEALHRLKTMQPELASSGIVALYLFGSHARDEARLDSDIDLAFDVRDGAGFSLLDQGRIKTRIEAMLDRHVDFVERAAIHPFLQERIARDLVRLF
jgi:uncharacterized protein